MLGAAGLLVGGYAIVVSDPVAPRAAPVQAAPVDRTKEDWAARAQVALASVNRQLDTIAQTEETWNRMPLSMRSGTPPVPVQRLEERKSLLQRRQAMLQSQLAAYRSLEQTADELTQAEQYLATVEKALADVPPPAQRTSEQTALAEQRDMRVRQRDAKREELRSLDAGVQSATRSPLPDDAPQTTAVSDEVLVLVAHQRDGGPPPAGPTTGRHPAAVGGRDEEVTRPRIDVDTSGPPDPRGQRNQSAGRPAAAANAATAVTGAGIDDGTGAGRHLLPGGVAVPVDAGRTPGPGDGVRSGGPAAERGAAPPVPPLSGLPADSGPGANGSGVSGPGMSGPAMTGPGAGPGAAPSGWPPPGGSGASGTGMGAAPAQPGWPPSGAPAGGATGPSGPAAAGGGTAGPTSGPGDGSTPAPAPDGMVSSMAGPMVLSMTPSFAVPLSEAALQEADRQAAARMTGPSTTPA